MKSKKNYSSTKQPANATSKKTGASNSVSQNDKQSGNNKSAMTLKK